MSGLFGSTTIKGTRITDFAQTSASVGTTIPFLYGRAPTPGNVIWANLPPKESKTTKKQGKGGVKQETYTYTVPYAIAFCRGPIVGYWWIKRNGKIVYSQDPNAPVEDKAYAAKWLSKVMIFNGTSSQMPSSLIESYKGVGRVSPFRYLSYIAIPPEDVTDQGGAIPSYEAVPIASPSEVYLTSHPYAQVFADRSTIGFGPLGGEMKSVVLKGRAEGEKVTTGLGPSGGEIKEYIPPHVYEEAELGMAAAGGKLDLPPWGQYKDKSTVSFGPDGGAIFNPPLGEYEDSVVTEFGPTGGEISGIPTPPVEDGDVVLYLHPAGTDGDTTFNDAGPLARTITRTGSEAVWNDADAPGGTTAHFPVGTGGLRLAHVADDNPLDGPFQLDFKLKLDANFNSVSMAILGVADSGTYYQSYEWSVLVGANYIQFYYGSRGSNQAHYQFYFPVNIDLRMFNGAQMDMSIARDATGHWGAWVQGVPSTHYRFSPSGSGVGFGAITEGVPVNGVNLGATTIPYTWVGGNMTGVHASNDIPYEINELKFTVGGCRDIGVAYTPDDPSDPLTGLTDTLVDLQLNEWPLVDSSSHSQTVTIYGSITDNGDGTVTRGGGNSCFYTMDCLPIHQRNFYVMTKFTPSGVSGEQIIVDTRRIDNGQGGFVIVVHPSYGTIYNNMQGNLIYNSSVRPTVGVENLLEYSRVDFTGYLFLNGVLIASGPDTGDFTSPVFCVGGVTYYPLGVAGTPGWIYDYATMAVGSGHTENYDFYRASLFLENVDGSTNIVDVGNSSRTWDAHNGAEIDTSLGSPRLQFDGVGAYVVASNPPSLEFGTGDFKISFKARWSFLAGYQTVLSCGYTVDNPYSFILQTGYGDGLLNVYCKNTLVCGESGITPVADQDYNIEISRVAGVTTIKRDGVVTATGSDSNPYPDEQFSIGGGSSSGFNNYWFAGWISNFYIL